MSGFGWTRRGLLLRVAVAVVVAGTARGPLPDIGAYEGIP